MENKTKTKKKGSIEDSVSAVTDVPVWFKIIAYIITTFISLSTTIPMLLTFSISVSEEASLVNGYKLIPEKFSLDAYKYVFENGYKIWSAYGITIIVTVSAVLISLACMSMFAYVVSREYFPWRSQFLFVVFFTMIFTGGTVPTYMVVANTLNLRDTIWALILPGCITGYNVMIMKTYMKTSIPAAVVEAAKIDGASEFRTFFTIVLPMAVPVLATLGLFVAIQYWNGWYNAFLYIIKADHLIPIQLLLKRFENNMQFLANSQDMSFAESEKLASEMPLESTKMALVMMAVIPIMCAYPFFQKYFVRGITVGSVKG